MRSRLINISGWLAFFLAMAALASIFFLPVLGLDNIRYPLLASAICYLIAGLLGRSAWQSDKLEKMLVHPAFPLVLLLFASAAFIRIKFLQWPAGLISGVDFSHIDYAIWSTTLGRFMEIPIIPAQPTFTDFFGNHYSPVLFFHVAARFLVDSPYVSMAVHALSLSAAIPVLYALAGKLVDKGTAAILTLNYVLCGAVASTLQFEIHQESFYPLAFGLIFLGLYSKRAFLFIGTLLALATKEDAGVYLFPAFLLLGWFYPGRRKICLALSAVSLVYLIVVLKVLMPMHQPAAAAAPYYIPMWARYGANFREVAFAMITQPHLVIWDVISNKDLYKNLLQWGFLPALSPMGLSALPSIVVSSTAAGVQRSFGLYYGIVLVPIFFFASAHFLSRIKRRRVVAVLVLISGAFIGGSYLRFSSPLPFYPEVVAAAHTLSRLPKEETVMVQSGLLPFLPYQQNWLRIDSAIQIPPVGETAVAFFTGLSQGSMEGDIHAIGVALEQRGYRLVEKSGRLRLYR